MNIDAEPTKTRSASGFIGLPAAQALVRAGHIVYGVTRSESKVKSLAAEESEQPTGRLHHWHPH